MKALMWRKGGSVELAENAPEPALREDEVLVRVAAEGVCTTDLHMLRGRLRFAEPPWILGHEMAGVVHRVGKLAKGWRVGDRVAVDPVVGCGSCRHCQAGRKHLCPEGGELGTNYGSGGYGQYVTVPSGNLYKLPDELSFEEGAMMEPLNCTLGAVERVRGMAGARVVVFGSGPAGLLFVQLAKAYGAAAVTLVGTNEPSLALGRRLGADRTLNVQPRPLTELLEPDSFDVAIEAAGSAGAVRDCLHFVAGGGTIVLYGLNGEGKPTIDSDRIVGKDLTVITCISAPLLWGKCIELVRCGKINVKDIVTKKTSLEDGASLVNAMADGTWGTVKLMLLHDS